MQDETGQDEGRLYNLKPTRRVVITGLGVLACNGIGMDVPKRVRRWYDRWLRS